MSKKAEMPFAARLSKLQELVKEQGVDSLLVEDLVNIRYLTGLKVSAGALVVGKDTQIFLDGRYFDMAIKSSPVPVSLLTQTTLSDGFKKGIFGQVIGFDKESTLYARFEKLSQMAEGAKKKRQLVPLENLVLRRLRSIKSKEEAKALAKAAEMAVSGFRYGMGLLKKGISELEVARGIKTFWLREGADKESFEPIIAFGENSACPHHKPSGRKLKQGDIVLFDLGVTLQGYASDLTRTFFFGNANPQLKHIYQVVLEAQEETLKLCKPGTPLHLLDQKARSLITEAGFGPQFSHSLGHGIGLEVHELPSLPRVALTNSPEEVLAPGMAITIEPGIYLPKLGGVRIEDTVIISERGHKNLTKLPKEMIALDIP
ncbi:M24 family metallopeptidase [Estrella lausannensis]|uniref:Aminopeptidase P n=1 Tax=Estrella lausannensis TaxID=483423 RepID=A0A0H5E2L1_9BACT|nr:Xaa-Pro peptidase family protein [Estrella lausannensis]CRX37435.1 Aminopeptidase P [Estrella lausannensis]